MDAIIEDAFSQEWPMHQQLWILLCFTLKGFQFTVTDEFQELFPHMFLQHILLCVYPHIHALPLPTPRTLQLLPQLVSLLPQTVDLPHQQDKNLLELRPAAAVAVESCHYFLDILVLVADELDHLHLVLDGSAIPGGRSGILSEL